MTELVLRRERRTVDTDGRPRACFERAPVFAAVIAAVLVRNVFVSAHRTIAWAFATALLAVLLLPVVDRLARHMPRFLALVLTVVALAVISAGLWAGARSTIVREAENLKERAPVAATTLEGKYSWAKQADLTGRVDSLVAHIEKPSTGQRVEPRRRHGVGLFRSRDSRAVPDGLWPQDGRRGFGAVTRIPTR